MLRLKTPDYSLKKIPVDFQRQVLPGSFEFALPHLVDKEPDLSALRSRCRNNAGGTSAFDQAVLLKIVLLVNSRGLVSTRAIEAACHHNVLFMAISGDSCPYFTPLAAFVLELGDEVAKLFAPVLVVCDRQGLIGRDLFAIDSVKLPSNASKEKSGTRADFERQAARMEATVKTMMERQTAADASYHSEACFAQLANRRSTPAFATTATASAIPATPGKTNTKPSPTPCPYGNGSGYSFNGNAAMKCRGAERDCVPCDPRHQCLCKPGTTKTWQVAFFQGKRAGQENHTDLMKAKTESDTGKRMITARFATVEPVFGNLRHNKRPTRFSLRGRAKTDGQWKL